MRKAYLLLVALVFTHPLTSNALTWEEHVTKEYVREHPGLISVKVVEKEEGLLSFTVILEHQKPRYVVAHMKVGDNLRTLSESHTPMFTRTEKSTYYFSIPQEFLGTSSYSLGVSHVQEYVEREPFAWSRHYKSSFKFREELSEPIPVVGSVIYDICLTDFVAANATDENCANKVVLPITSE